MIIVTGGAGFIGSNLVATLLENGCGDVVVCDYLDKEEKRHNIAKHNVREVVAPESLLDFLDSNKDKTEVIFHMGAVSSTVETDKKLITDQNFRLPLKLWHWCINNNCRLFYASSAATYGDGSQGFVDDNSSDYLASLKPLNSYGKSKNLFDRKAIHLAGRGIAPKQWAGFKFFNVYGPNEYHKAGQKSVAYQMFAQINKTGQVRLFKSYREDYEDGGQLRDFIYVKDCCEVLLWFLKNENISGIFNVGTGNARSFNDLAAAVFKSVRKAPARIEYFDMPQQVKEHYQYFTQASLDNLRKAGYDKPLTSLEDGIYDYINNYLSKEDPYR